MLFGLINKVAGVYGLITVFIGANFSQYMFYAYSVVTLFAFMWGLGKIKEVGNYEDRAVADTFRNSRTRPSSSHTCTLSTM